MSLRIIKSAEVLSIIANHLREKSSTLDYIELLEVTEEVNLGVALANRDLENTLIFPEIHTGWIIFI